MPKRATLTPIPIRRALGLIGRHLADWRRLHGLRAEVVADRAGISVATLQRIEAGSGASLENVLRVARSLGVLDRVVTAFDPSETDVGRARALERLPKRVRRRRGEIP